MYRRAILSLAVIFTLLPLTATAGALPPTEVGRFLPRYTLLQPLPVPVEPVATPVEEIPVPVPEPVYTPPPVATGTIPGCGDNTYAQFIYAHESGCRLDATNSIGCTGIGQACPGSKLYAVCPDLNYNCQNQFFTDYAYSAYGSWQAAYTFWIGHSWW